MAPLGESSRSFGESSLPPDAEGITCVDSLVMSPCGVIFN